MLEQTQPLSTTKPRLVFVDALRGFALLGILWVHQPVFMNLSNDYFPTQGAESLLFRWINILGTGSFYPIFAFLFGWGLATQFPNLQDENKSQSDLRFMKRRLWVLLGIGTFHGIFIWYGDFLVMYAITGFFMLQWVQKETPQLLQKMKRLLIWGTVLGIAFFTWFELDNSTSSSLDSDSSFLEFEIMMRSSQYFTVVWANAILFVAMTMITPFYGYFSSLPLFILGFVVGREKAFHNVETHLPFLKKWVFPALVVGFGLKLLEFTPYYFLKAIGIVIGAPLLSVGYLFAFILLWHIPKYQKILFPFHYVGKMGLTNYILHSLICTLIYYGYGLSGYSWITDIQSMLVVVLVYGVIMAFSIFWQKHFHFGILEWLWKWATYQEKPILRKH